MKHEEGARTQKAATLEKSLTSCKLLLVAVLGATLLSCVPFHTDVYHRPSAAEGHVIRANCPPVPSFWLIERDGVLVGTRVRKWGAETTIELTFEIPEGKNVTMLSHTISVVTPNGTARKLDLSGNVMEIHGRSQTVQLGDLLTGGRKSLFGPGFLPYANVRNKVYWFSASFAAEIPDQLTVHFPSFLVDGAERAIPDVNFSQDSEFHWITSLNC